MADAQHLPQGRHQAGDRHLKFHEDRDNLPAAALGIGRTTADELVRTGRWPTPVLRLGNRIRVPTAALRELLSLSDRPEQPCDAVDELARRQLAQVEQRLARLSVLKGLNGSTAIDPIASAFSALPLVK